MNSSCLSIRTERLVIKAFTEQHITKRYVGWMNDADRMRYSEQRHKKHTIASCRSYFQSFTNTASQFLAIETSEKNLGHIGNITVNIDTNNAIADISILIGDSRAAGKGYGYEAFQGIVHYLFKHNNIRKITAGTVADNSAMLHIMKKLRMKPDGIRKRHYIIDGQEVDVIHMALFKEDYTHSR